MRNPYGKWYVCVAAFAALACAARAEVDEDVRYAMELLRDEYPGVRFYERESRITRVYGRPMSFSNDPVDSAELFMICHSEVFAAETDDLFLAGFPGGVDIVQPVMYQQETDTYKFYLCRYEQCRGGIPVYGADLRLLVRNEPDFPLVLAASSLRNLGDFIPDTDAVPPDFNPADYIDGDFDHFSSPVLVIWPISDDGAGPRLAYKFTATRGSPADDDYGKWRFFADAFNGQVLHQEDALYYNDVTGNVSGMATEGNKAEQCEDEVSMIMPHALVCIADPNDPNDLDSCITSVYAGDDGAFVLPNSGDDPVKVLSVVSGEFFTVYDYADPNFDAALLSWTGDPPRASAH